MITEETFKRAELQVLKRYFMSAYADTENYLVKKQKEKELKELIDQYIINEKLTEKCKKCPNCSGEINLYGNPTDKIECSKCDRSSFEKIITFKNIDKIIKCWNDGFVENDGYKCFNITDIETDIIKNISIVDKYKSFKNKTGLQIDFRYKDYWAGSCPTEEQKEATQNIVSYFKKKNVKESETILILKA